MDSGRLYDKDGTYFSDTETGLWSNKYILLITYLVFINVMLKKILKNNSSI